MAPRDEPPGRSINAAIFRGKQLATYQELSAFLAEVDRRAYKYALFALRDEDAALDVVQDSMLKLAEHYGHNPVEELPALFQRILQNRIRDYFRRQKVRSLWTTLLSSLTPSEDHGSEIDPLETIEVADGVGGVGGSPDELFSRQQVLNFIEEGLINLPARQRQAFVLRYWEDMDVAETAAVMGCSEGSVKTHCSRATHALAGWLQQKGVER